MQNDSSDPKTTTTARLTEGATVKLTGAHQWRGERGTLVAFEEYGLGWKGWRVALNNGVECYASTLQLQKVSP